MPAEPAFSERRYRTIVADPPWEYWRRTGSLRTVDRFDTFPRELSPAEIARIEGILRRTGRRP
jgi:hypothetical protein